MNDPLIKRPLLPISRRVVVGAGLRLAYATPLITASYRLNTGHTSATDYISTDPGEDNDPNKNAAPVAVVGEGFEVVDEDGDGVETVAINGSASSDSNGVISSYLWTLGGEWLSNEAATSVSLPIGTHRLVLTVTDEQGATGENTLRIRVKEGAPAQDVPEEEVSDVVLPPPPYRVEATQKFAEVALTWLVDEGITPPYRIYSAIDDGLGRPTDEIEWFLTWEEWEKLSFRDTVVEIGVPYLYVVRTFDGINESENSNVAAITLQPVEEELPEEEAPPEVDEPADDAPVEDPPIDEEPTKDDEAPTEVEPELEDTPTEGEVSAEETEEPA